MKVLVIGGGGREHAIVDALTRSPSTSEIVCTPGNPGIAAQVRCVAAAQEPDALAALAQQEGADLVIVGPEGPLAAGVVDALQQLGIPAFGPSRAAARLEGDKAWSKAFMQRHAIPTARWRSFETLPAALDYAQGQALPLVVKDAGLRAGKGVTICATSEQAEEALRAIFEQPGAGAVIEEFMVGQEVSVLAFADGVRAVQMPPSQDHKTIFEHDQGPMTGGMGVICPYPLGPEARQQIQTTILDAVMRGMAAEGMPFCGVLYAGLMLTTDGPKVVEFNARFGDPEAEAVLPLLTGDLAAIAQACAQGTLDAAQVQFSGAASAVVILAAPGYPGEPQRGIPLGLPSPAMSQRVYHAGTALQAGQLVSAGGRVLALQASAPTLPAALREVYTLAAQVEFEGAQYRRDIGGRLGLTPDA
ncbi:phosphoribosylamine--glycine ligase [Deinococcus sp. KNUC1210]|uniref:phosphoribosylamine--glycine ligase n=1 Tax=Deinococcus sp. KNUC1210 TaxID=2917691 RepID=UPI001EF0F500|nr:phosphoribosylamine--glycine ligase [Deinococcus sp. KNUC1210]ULH16041.1 phosphoribosylamine--glycine ligase [Deinococcus sp. KNUC1210]